MLLGEGLVELVEALLGGGIDLGRLHGLLGLPGLPPEEGCQVHASPRGLVEGVVVLAAAAHHLQPHDVPTLGRGTDRDPGVRIGVHVVAERRSPGIDHGHVQVEPLGAERDRRVALARLGIERVGDEAVGRHVRVAHGRADHLEALGAHDLIELVEGRPRIGRCGRRPTASAGARGGLGPAGALRLALASLGGVATVAVPAAWRSAAAREQKEGKDGNCRSEVTHHRSSHSGRRGAPNASIAQDPRWPGAYRSRPPARTQPKRFFRDKRAIVRPRRSAVRRPSRSIPPLILVALLAVSSAPVQAQEPPSSPAPSLAVATDPGVPFRHFAITADPLAVALGTYAAHIEVSFARHHAFFVAPGWVSRGAHRGSGSRPATTSGSVPVGPGGSSSDRWPEPWSKGCRTRSSPSASEGRSVTSTSGTGSPLAWASVPPTTGFRTVTASRDRPRPACGSLSAGRSEPGSSALSPRARG